MGMIRDWWNGVVQSVVWKSFFGHLQPLDWIILFLLLCGVVYGIRRGFWKTISDILRVCLVIIFAFELGHRAAKYLTQYVGGIPSKLTPVAGFILVVIITWFALSLLFKLLRKAFSVNTSGVVRVFGGGALGGLYFFLSLSLWAQPVLLSPYEKLKRPFTDEKTYFGKALAQTAPKIYVTVSRPVKKIWNQTIGKET